MAVRRLAAETVQPKDFAFTPENEAWVKRQIAKYPPGRQASAVLPLLWQAQKQNDYWLPKPAIEKVAEMLGMPYIRVLEVATFYSMFNLEPVGRHFIQLCGTTPCVLRGAEDLKKVCRERIGEQHHVSADGQFSWAEVECLGACCNAPMVQINDDYFEDLTAERLSKLMDDLAAGRPVKIGSQVGRTTSEPEPGKATTLNEAALFDGSRVGAWRHRFEEEKVRAKAKAEADRMEGQAETAKAEGSTPGTEPAPHGGAPDPAKAGATDAKPSPTDAGPGGDAKAIAPAAAEARPTSAGSTGSSQPAASTSPAPPGPIRTPVGKETGSSSTVPNEGSPDSRAAPQDAASAPGSLGAMAAQSEAGALTGQSAPASGSGYLGSVGRRATGEGADAPRAETPPGVTSAGDAIAGTSAEGAAGAAAPRAVDSAATAAGEAATGSAGEGAGSKISGSSGKSPADESSVSGSAAGSGDATATPSQHVVYSAAVAAGEGADTASKGTDDAGHSAGRASVPASTATNARPAAADEAELTRMGAANEAANRDRVEGGSISAAETATQPVEAGAAEPALEEATALTAAQLAAEETATAARLSALPSGATSEQRADVVGTRPSALGAPRAGSADNLKLIRGIGPVNERKLHELGVFHFDQIGAWTRAEIRWVGTYLAFPGRIDREKWVEQARDLAVGRAGGASG